MAPINQLVAQHGLIPLLQQIHPPITTAEQLLTTPTLHIYQKLQELRAISYESIEDLKQQIIRTCSSKRIKANQLLQPSIFSLTVFEKFGIPRKWSETLVKTKPFLDIVGSSGSGKTECCIALAIRACGQQYPVFYISHELNGVLRRIRRKYPKRQEQDLLHLYLHQPENLENLIQLLVQLQTQKQMVLIVDSLSFYFDSILVSSYKSDNTIGFSLLAEVGLLLRKLCVLQDCFVVTTQHCKSKSVFHWRLYCDIQVPSTELCTQCD